MPIGQTLLNIYDKHYKKLMLASLLLLLLCFVSLGITYTKTGELFQKGVTLKGGITMTIPISEPVNIQQLTEAVSKSLPKADIGIREIVEGGNPKALIVEAADAEVEELENALQNNGIALEQGKYSVESMGSALGQSFYAQTIKAVIFAFIAMALVVFMTFRAFVPSLFVILAAFSDIISTLAVIDLLGVKISTAGIAAFLMLIGYSVDTDILLTTKVLKRKGEGGNIFQRTVGAMKTGCTMTMTGFAAAMIGFLFTQSDVIKQIMLIIAIGLLFDLVYTWFQNAGILRWYMEKHGQN